MKLTNRLLKIASLVDNEVVIADIGTDHGYIPTYLLERGTINRAILSDINKGPLENAREEIARRKLLDKTELRLGGGVSVLEVDEVDEIVIAGMGGILISDIIRDGMEVCKNAKKLILQPMQAQEELRKYLLSNGFDILNEHLVNEDFRIYEIIEARYSGVKNNGMDEIYYEIPQLLIQRREPLLYKILSKKIRECDDIISRMKGILGESVEKRRSEVILRKEKLKYILSEMEE